jgi:hypothetical protein
MFLRFSELDVFLGLQPISIIYLLVSWTYLSQVFFPVWSGKKAYLLCSSFYLKLYTKLYQRLSCYLR